MIEINKVGKKIDNVIILDNITLKLYEGNIYGFVGRNGSGKTMLFRTICGLIFPDEGEIIINNQKLNKNINYGNIGVLIEKPKFINSLSGFENLKILASLNNKISDSDINQILKKFELYDYKDKKYHKYSLGMKQKLGIVQAIMENPDIIILDEPFNGLDDGSVKMLRNILMELKKQNKIILIATHLKEDIEILCDYVYRMDGGKIEKLTK